MDQDTTYRAMTEAVEGARDALSLYDFTAGISLLAGRDPIIWVEGTIRDHSQSFDNVPDFEKWASDTITAHQE